METEKIHGLEESFHEVHVDDNGNEVPVNEKKPFMWSLRENLSD